MVVVLVVLYRCMSFIETLIKESRLNTIAQKDPQAGRIQSQEESKGVRRVFDELTRLKLERERRLSDKKPKAPMMKTVGLVDTVGVRGEDHAS
jgi:hypothetical protein